MTEEVYDGEVGAIDSACGSQQNAHNCIAEVAVLVLVCVHCFAEVVVFALGQVPEEVEQDCAAEVVVPEVAPEVVAQGSVAEDFVLGVDCLSGVTV